MEELLELEKRIIITIVDGFHYKYLVDTGILDEILAQQHIKVVIFTIKSLMDKLSARYEGRITVKELQHFIDSSPRKYFRSLRLRKSSKLSETLNIKNENRSHDNTTKFLNNLSQTGLARNILSLSSSFLKNYYRADYYRNYIRYYKPDLIVLSTPGQKLLDLELLYEAKRAGIKTISPVYSWDNLTAKGPFIFNPDKLIVWNKVMQDEALKFHQYTENKVFVCGVPVFDAYLQVLRETEGDKQNFFKTIGINENNPLISITTIPQVYFGNCHIALVNRILKFMDEGKITKASIIIRPHPMDETDYSCFNNLKNVILDYYGSLPDNSLCNWQPQEDNAVHLGRTMKYSNIVINIASTITIDAACFNTPVINIAYDFKESDRDYQGSIKRYYLYTHYKHVVESGASQLVYNDEEMVLAINQYMKDPNLDAQSRQALVAMQTGKLDGLAYKRIAHVILKETNNK